jgi:hypothetical protein
MTFRGPLAFALLASLAHAAPPPAVRLDLDARIDTAAAWLEPAESSSSGTVNLDDRVPLHAIVLEGTVERGRWPATLTIAWGDEEAIVTVPKAARDARALTLRFREPQALRSVEIRDGEASVPSERVRVRPISAAELRGDTLEGLLPKVIGSAEDRVHVAAIVEHGSEATYDALGRQWRSLEAPAQLTVLDRLGPSRCTAGLAFLARLVVDGGEPGERAEKLLASCGPRAAEGLAVRFQSLDLAHRAKLAPVFARSDASKAFLPLLDATAAAEGRARRTLRAALAQAVRKLSEALVREKLRDGTLPLETRLTLAATVTAEPLAPDLAEVARTALASASATTRRRGIWLAGALPATERAALRGALREAYEREETAALREAVVEALGSAAVDDDVARFLVDRSPSVRAHAASLAEAGQRRAVGTVLREQLAREEWLVPATRMARALATLDAGAATHDLLRAKYEGAKNSAFAAAFLEARASAGDRRVLADARKIVRDDRAIVDLRIAGVHAYRTLGDRSLDAELVRLARRALDPLTEDDLPLAYACLEALADLADDTDREKLRPLLEAKDPALRHAAKAAFQGTRTP